MHSSLTDYISLVAVAIKQVHSKLFILKISKNPNPVIIFEDLSSSFDAKPLEELLDLSLRKIKTDKFKIESISREKQSAQDFYAYNKNLNAMHLCRYSDFNVVDSISFKGDEIPVPYDTIFSWESIKCIPKIVISKVILDVDGDLKEAFECQIVKTDNFKLIQKSNKSSPLNKFLGISSESKQQRFIDKLKEVWFHEVNSNQLDYWKLPYVSNELGFKRLLLSTEIKKTLSGILQERDPAKRSTLYHRLIFQQDNRARRLATWQDYLQELDPIAISMECLSTVATRTIVCNKGSIEKMLCSLISLYKKILLLIPKGYVVHIEIKSDYADIFKGQFDNEENCLVKVLKKALSSKKPQVLIMLQNKSIFPLKLAQISIENISDENSLVSELIYIDNLKSL